jgi:hypothetical protein
VLGYQDTSLKEMTLQNRINTPLSDTEYDDMLALKNAINYDISTVVPEKMEEFSDYLVRSLRELGG